MLKYGSSIDVAENGQIAVEKYKNHPFELVLMDVMMPVMDGLQATEAIRTYEEEAALDRAVIIAVSANFQDEDYQEYLSKGFDEVFKKPVDFAVLNDFLKNYFTLS